MDYVRYELGLSTGEYARVSTSPETSVRRLRDAESWLVTCENALVTVYALEAGEMREIGRARRQADGHLIGHSGLYPGFPNSRQWGLIEQTIPRAIAAGPGPDLSSAQVTVPSEPTARIPRRVVIAFAVSIAMVLVFVSHTISQWGEHGRFPLHGGLAIAMGLGALLLAPVLMFVGIVGLGGVVSADSDPTASRVESVKLDGRWVLLQRRRDGTPSALPEPQDVDFKVMMFVIIAGIVLFALGFSAVA